MHLKCCLLISSAAYIWSTDNLHVDKYYALSIYSGSALSLYVSHFLLHIFVNVVDL